VFTLQWLTMIFSKYVNGIREYGTWYTLRPKYRHNPPPPPPQTPPQSVDLFTENTPHIFVLEYIFGFDDLTHRVERVQVIRIGIPPPPSPAGEYVPSPFGSAGGGAHSFAADGVGGVPIRTRVL
jgi:hypothetical protein